MRRTRTSSIVPAILGFALALSGGAFAATGTWNGGGGGDTSWNTAANWGGSLPDFDDGDSVVDDVVFSTLNANGDATTLDGDKTINSLTFAAGSGISYSIDGDVLTIKTGVVDRSSTGAQSTQTINSDIILGADGTFTSNGNHNTLSRLHVDGSIGDGGNNYGITRNGSRYMEFNGNNTYTGPTIINNGYQTRFNGSNLTSSVTASATTVINGDFTAASTWTFNNGGYINISNPANISASADFVFNGGTLASTNSLANITFNNPITMLGNLTIAGTDNITLTSNIDLDGDRTVDVNTSTSSATQTLSGVIGDGTGGPHQLTLTGSRPFALSGNNTYSGGTKINGGLSIAINHNNAFGTGTITINGTPGMNNASGVVVSNPIIVNNNFYAGPYFDADGPMTLATNTTISYNGVTNSTLMLEGDIGESGGSRSLSTGSYGNRNILLSGNNSFSGGFTITNLGAGTPPLYLGHDNALGTGTFTVASTNGQNILAAAGAGPITVTNPIDHGSLNIVIGDVSEVLNFHASSWTGTGNVSVASGSSVGGAGTLASNVTGAGALIKDDPGVLEVTGNNNYTGGTTITTGTLLANGGVSALGSGTVNVNGGTLGGTGVIAAPVNVNPGGTIAPGNSPGILTIDDDLLLDTGSTFVAELNGGLAGTQYDALSASGNITINNADLVLILGYVPNPTDKLYLVINSGANPINGTFNALPDGTIIELGEYNGVPVKATISYFGDSNVSATTGGNDIVLYNFSIPEPATLSLLTLAGLGLVRRRRSC